MGGATALQRGMARTSCGAGGDDRDNVLIQIRSGGSPSYIVTIGVTIVTIRGGRGVA